MKSWATANLETGKAGLDGQGFSKVVALERNQMGQSFRLDPS
jgi:hypothetical protein